MRVLAVAQRLAQRAGDGQALRESLAALRGEPGGDRGVIGGGAGIGLAGQPAAQRRAWCRHARRAPPARSAYCAGSVRTATRVVVLGRGADQRRAADVDVLDAVLGRGAARDRRLERVEVDARPGRSARCRAPAICAHMLGQVAAAENAAMDLRHQRLHPAVEDLRKAGVVGRPRVTAMPGLAQRPRRAAGGQDLRAVRGQRRGEGAPARSCRRRRSARGGWGRSSWRGHTATAPAGPACAPPPRASL